MADLVNIFEIASFKCLNFGISISPSFTWGAAFTVPSGLSRVVLVLHERTPCECGLGQSHSPVPG